LRLVAKRRELLAQKLDQRVAAVLVLVGLGDLGKL